MANTALTCVVLGSKAALGTHGVHRAPMTIPGRRPDRGLRYVSPKRTSQKSHTPGATRITDGGKADERAGRLHPSGLATPRQRGSGFSFLRPFLFLGAASVTRDTALPWGLPEPTWTPHWVSPGAEEAALDGHGGGQHAIGR